MRARGIIVLVKSKKGQIDGQKYRDKQLKLAERDSTAIVLVFKAGAFRY